MEFSTGFLNKLLDSAIKYYNTDNDVEPIPDKLINTQSAIEKFSDALVYEAHNSMSNEIIANDIPILHAVNLNTKNPGIISAKTENDKYHVHKKTKIKKDKTPEQIQKELEKAQDRLESKKLKK